MNNTEKKLYTRKTDISLHVKGTEKTLQYAEAFETLRNAYFGFYPQIIQAYAKQSLVKQEKIQYQSKSNTFLMYAIYILLFKAIEHKVITEPIYYKDILPILIDEFKISEPVLKRFQKINNPFLKFEKKNNSFKEIVVQPLENVCYDLNIRKLSNAQVRTYDEVMNYMYSFFRTIAESKFQNAYNYSTKTLGNKMALSSAAVSALKRKAKEKGIDVKGTEQQVWTKVNGMVSGRYVVKTETNDFIMKMPLSYKTTSKQTVNSRNEKVAIINKKIAQLFLDNPKEENKDNEQYVLARLEPFKQQVLAECPEIYNFVLTKENSEELFKGALEVYLKESFFLAKKFNKKGKILKVADPIHAKTEYSNSLNNISIESFEKISRFDLKEALKIQNEEFEQYKLEQKENVEEEQFNLKDIMENSKKKSKAKQLKDEKIAEINREQCKGVSLFRCSLLKEGYEKELLELPEGSTIISENIAFRKSAFAIWDKNNKSTASLLSLKELIQIDNANTSIYKNQADEVYRLINA